MTTAPDPATQAKPALYVALELDENATPLEIKASYERLVKRLQENPTPTSEERQLILNQAYTILTDPQKREMYDKFGDKAWELLQHPYIDALFQRMDSHTMIKVGLVLLVVLSVLGFIQTIVFALRIDESVHWYWSWCLFPLWVYDALGGLVMLYLLIQALKAWRTKRFEKEGLSPQQLRKIRIDQVVMQLYFWCYFLYTVAVGWALDNNGKLYGLYIVLPIAAECIGFASTIPRCKPSRIRAKMDAQSGTFSSGFSVALVTVLSVISATWRLPFLILAALNTVWGKVGINWFLVGTPLFLGILALWEYPYTFAKQKTTSKLQAFLVIIPMAFVEFMVLLSAVLMCDKLNGAGRSVGDALVPLYIVQFAFIGFAVALVVVFKFYDKEMKKAAVARQYTQPGSGVEGVVQGIHSVQHGPPPKTAGHVA